MRKSRGGYLGFRPYSFQRGTWGCQKNKGGPFFLFLCFIAFLCDNFSNLTTLPLVCIYVRNDGVFDLSYLTEKTNYSYHNHGILTVGLVRLGQVRLGQVRLGQVRLVRIVEVFDEVINYLVRSLRQNSQTFNLLIFFDFRSSDSWSSDSRMFNLR